MEKGLEGARGKAESSRAVRVAQKEVRQLRPGEMQHGWAWGWRGPASGLESERRKMGQLRGCPDVGVSTVEWFCVRGEEALGEAVLVEVINNSARLSDTLVDVSGKPGCTGVAFGSTQGWRWRLGFQWHVKPWVICHHE